MTNHFIDNHIQPLDLQQENANLRDLLNESMAENVELLRQVVSMQEALYEAQGALLSANKRIDELTRELADARASHHSAMFLLDAVQGDCNGWHDGYVALLKWSQAAYKRLNDSNGIRVPSMQKDAIAALLVAAPANVAAEVDPFSAELDATYSIYTDPLIVGVAEGLDCTVDELMEYAMDSVGASGIQTIEGCHSAGLHSCYGGLWTCTGCGNRFCDAEGSDNMPELCNDCWFKAQGVAK